MSQPSVWTEKDGATVSAVPPLQPSDFIEWDVRNWSAALDFWRDHSRQDLSNCTALEIGSRNGGLALWLASQGAHVVCSDVELPGERAVRNHRTRGVSHLVEYRALDAMNIPYSEDNVEF